MSSLPAHLDFPAFTARVGAARAHDPARVVRAASNLVEGALRIRRGNEGLYGVVERPVTKPAEALGSWIHSLEREIVGGEPFYRTAEAAEALVAAAEEVDAATEATPAATRLRNALYSDALTVVGGGGESRWRPYLPWIISSVLGGILIGILMARRK